MYVSNYAKRPNRFEHDFKFIGGKPKYTIHYKGTHSIKLVYIAIQALEDVTLSMRVSFCKGIPPASPCLSISQ